MTVRTTSPSPPVPCAATTDGSLADGHQGQQHALRAVGRSDVASATAHRGQGLYRVAKVLEGRRAQFVDEVAVAGGLTARAAVTSVEAAIDPLVWYAGWTDKVVLGDLHPVAEPFVGVCVPEPTAVAGVLAPTETVWHPKGV